MPDVVTVPAWALQLDLNDRIIVQYLSFYTTHNVVLRIRMLTPDGQIVTSKHLCSVTSTEAVLTYTVSPGPGHLLSVDMIDDYTGLPYGGTFARATLCRLENGSPRPISELCAGYVTDLISQSWPSMQPDEGPEGVGSPELLSVAAPAAGANIAFTVPTYASYDVMAVSFRFVTAVAAATRRIILFAGDGSGAGFKSVCATTQTASLTYDYSFGPVGILETSISSCVEKSFPALHLAGGSRINTLIENIQAADQISRVRLFIKTRIRL